MAMDTSVEDAIITGIAAAEVTGHSLIDEIANSLSMSAGIAKDADDPVTASDLERLAKWARSKGE